MERDYRARQRSEQMKESHFGPKMEKQYKRRESTGADSSKQASGREAGSSPSASKVCPEHA